MKPSRHGTLNVSDYFWHKKLSEKANTNGSESRIL